MQFDLTVSVEALGTVVGASVIVVILTMFTKHYLPDWRFTPLLVLLQSEVLCVGASLIVGAPSSTALANAALTGLVAAALAVFGYEAVINALGHAGVGPRSEQALERSAREALERVGMVVTESVARNAKSAK